jgi:hypothetical protein
MDNWVVWVQLGLAGAMLSVLYLGLARGRIHTERSVQRMEKLMELRLADKDAIIKRQDELADKLDARNELLASHVGEILEIARAQGMVQALPPHVAKEIIR